jgi:exodeoxyribonuclease VII small subunit
MASQKQPTFEDMLNQLESIVKGIEEGKIGLQQSIAEYEKGMKLIQQCRKMLADAEAKVQKLQLSETGQLTPSPMETEEPEDTQNPPADQE